MLIMIYLYNISRIILPLQMLCNRLVIYTYVNILNLGCCRDIPFNVHTPLWTRSIKFEPLRKKDQSADTSTPSEIKKFLPYPSKDKRMPMHTPPQKWLFQTPSEILVHRGGGGCTLNGMALIAAFSSIEQ
jgi:hypothetical protein